MKKSKILCLGLLALSCSGCSSLSQGTSSSKSSPWSISKLWAKEYQQPRSIAAIWVPDVLSMPGKPATRGFGGRIYFYNERSQAIPVDGDLIVHGYLRDSRFDPSDQPAADKTFGFTAEQLTSHFSPSEMGASYSVWIPWDAADGFRAEVTLIPTFKSKDGSIVQGSPAKVNLPGRAKVGGESPEPVLQTVSYTKTSTPTNLGPDTANATMRTTTINVPPNASLGTRRVGKSLTLGAPANGPTAPVTTAQPTATMGVGVGASATGASNALPQRGLLPASSAPENTSNSSPLDIQGLAPPPSLNLVDRSPVFSQHATNSGFAAWQSFPPAVPFPAATSR